MRVFGIAALAMVLLAGGVAAQSPSPEPSVQSQPGVTQELLGFTFPAGSSEARLVLVRTTLERGERIDDVGVTGVRVPDERELRGWPRGVSGAGPLRAVGRDAYDLLVGWSGTVCGPIVTLTVEPRLRSMRLIDRSPGCDASAMGHWLVLRLRTSVGIPMRDIPFESVRRVP